MDPLKVVTGKALQKGADGLFWYHETLECGHSLPAPLGLGSGYKPAKRRRCWKCGGAA